MRKPTRWTLLIVSAAVLAAAGCILEDDGSFSGADGGAGDESLDEPIAALGTIVRKASLSRSSAGTSLSISPPSGTVAGDYLVAQAVLRSTTGSPTPPSGWTLLGKKNDAAGQVSQAAYGRFATAGSMGAGTWTAPAGTRSFTVSITGFAGVNPTTPVRESSTATVAGTGAIRYAPAGLSGLTANDVAVLLLATSGGPRPWAESGALLGVIPEGSVPGRYVDRATLLAFENNIGRKVAFGHSWLPWNFNAGFPAGTTKGPNGDFADGRLSWFSWPSEQAASPFNGSTDPGKVMADIASGAYDGVIAQNARVLKAWGQPLFFRLFCEMNGGDHPWEVGHQTNPALTETNYSVPFNRAWRRIWIITRGTAADADALGYDIAAANLVHADNVLFHWNPQNFQTTSQVSWDELWPGDKFVDFAGTEAYLSTKTFEHLMTENDGGRGIHPPLYANFGPGGQFNQKRGGLMGNGEGGATSVKSIDSYLSSTIGMPTYRAWKFFTWWNYNNFKVSAMSGALRTSALHFLNGAYMKPALTRSFDVPSGWTAATQYRYETGRAAGANVGSDQSASMMLVKLAGSASVTAPTVVGYGYGNWSAISIALRP